MAKIYVSSTFLDLQDYRAQVEKTIRRMGHIDVAMEYYVAEDKRPVERCIADVETCDLYIGIFAWRYGWIPEKKNRKKLSITEMEYQYAEKLKKPCLIFLLDGKAAWPPDFIDDEKTKIKKLRNLASEKHSSGPNFRSPDDLGRLVAEAINKWEKETGIIQFASEIPEHNLDVYYAALRKRYDIVALEGLTSPQTEEYWKIKLCSVFVEPNVRENSPPIELPKDMWEKLIQGKEIHTDDFPWNFTSDDMCTAKESYFGNLSNPVLDTLVNSSHQHAIILGDPGSGKSTLARYIMLSLVNTEGDEKLRSALDGYLPLLIELRTYAGLCADGHCQTFLEFLEYLGKTEGWALTQAALNNHLKNDGRAVVIFDGIDEIFNPKQRERVTHQIVGFCNNYRKARIIVTSRLIGYRRKILTDAGFSHFTLQDLDEQQIELFVARWYRAMCDRIEEAREQYQRILKSLKASESIRQLAGNPMLLTIMTILGKNQDLPRERWKLYDHAASVLIQHWDVNKHLKDLNIDADFIGEDDKKELLRRLAFRMQTDNQEFTGNLVHSEDLQAEFESYLAGRYRKPPDQAKVIAEAMIRQLRERNFILSLYGANLYCFVHRAFLEYFCASALVRKFEKIKDLTIDQLKTDFYGKYWKDHSWHEVLRLICGMIDPKWVEEIIDYLTREIYRPWPKKFGKLPPWNISLAVACLGEVQNINNLAESAKALIHLVCEVINYVFTNREIKTTYYGRELHYASYNGILKEDFLEGQLLKNIEAIGEKWPGRDLFLELLPRAESFEKMWKLKGFEEFICAVSINLETAHKILSGFIKHSKTNGAIKILSILHKYFPDGVWTLELLFECLKKDKDPDMRSAAFSALSENYFSVLSKHHYATKISGVLRKFAVKDENEKVRRTAVSALADQYHDDPETPQLLRKIIIEDVHEIVRDAAVYRLARYYHDDPETLRLLHEYAIKDENGSVRQTALSALIKHYRDNPKTLPILHERAVKDDFWNMRRTALSALVEHYRYDPKTLELICEMAMNSKDKDVRKEAVSKLAEYYREDPETLPFLYEHAVKDNCEDVRRAAVSALTKHYREDSATFPLLCEWAEKSENYDVRENAVRAIAEHYHEIPETLSFLRRVTKDVNGHVRSAAVLALVKNYRDNPETFPFLLEHALKDNSEYVRSSAVYALAEDYHENPETLPLLCEHATKDVNGCVRKDAVNALVRYYQEAPETLSLLCEHAILDDIEDVRRIALVSLAHLHRYGPEVLPRLREHAVEDNASSVRCVAVAALADDYYDDPETLPLLHERAVKDESPESDDEKPRFQVGYVRQIAIDSIAEYWPNHPETLTMLHERAKNDPTPWLRERAKELIERLETNSAQI